MKKRQPALEAGYVEAFFERLIKYENYFLIVVFFLVEGGEKVDETHFLWDDGYRRYLEGQGKVTVGEAGSFYT